MDYSSGIASGRLLAVLKSGRPEFRAISSCHLAFPAPNSRSLLNRASKNPGARCPQMPRSGPSRESDLEQTPGSIGAMSADDDIPDELLVDAEKLTGLSLELLGLDPHPDHMTAEQRLQLDPEDLAEMAAVAPEERQKSARQTHLLAGLLWNSSGIIAGTSPGCLAAELAVRCLLDQAEITEDIYEVDLPDDWRADVEEVLLEDADSEGLFSDRLEDLEDDARELDFEHWFEPFTPGDAVPPYAYS